MNILLMVVFAGIVITIVFKVAHLIYLLLKLGFNFEVIKLLTVLGVVGTFASFILLGTDYSTAGLFISSLIGGAILPSLFNITDMKPKSHYGEKKPINVTDSNYAWSYYGGNGDCGNVGFSNSSSTSFNSDSGSGDCGGGGD